jgi:beta-lactamase class A
MSALGNQRSPIGPHVAGRGAVPESRMARRRATRRRHRWQLAGSLCAVVLVTAGAVAILGRGAPPARRSNHQANGRAAAGTTSTRSTVAAASHHVAPGSSDLFAEPSVAAYMTATIPEDVTAAVYDDVTGVTSVYRPATPEITGSSIKVDILTTLLAQDQATGQSLAPAQQALSQAMIEQSDNDDAQTLWDQEGGAQAVESFDTSAGLTQTDPDSAGFWGLSSTTVADQVQLLRTLAYPSAVLTPASQSYVLGLMSHVESGQAWGVSAGPGTSASVALKDGWLPIDSGGWQVNSEGYVNGDGRDYVIAVMTYGASEPTGIAAIEGLSSLIWQALAPSTS